MSGSSYASAVWPRAVQKTHVLVALCDPVQPHTFYRKSPSADSWFVGILSPVEDVSDSFKTRRPPPPTVAP